MKKKKLLVPILVGVVTLGVLVVGATFAYFTVATTSSFGTRKATVTAESVGTVAVAAGNDLSLTVSRVQMGEANKGNVYYATGDNISSGTLGTVTVTGEGMYSCDYTMSITLSGTMLSSIKDDRNTILYVNDIPYDIYTYKDAGTITLNGTINGLVQATPQRIKGNIAIFNTEKDQSSELAGKTISASIKVTGITCTAGDDLLASKIIQLSGQTSGDGVVINLQEGDYRYSGSNPNNYITFNNETWRIIGIVDGYVKIIRNESLGNYIWDYKNNGVGSSITEYGSNDWTDSQLMMMLNPSEYLKEGYTINNNMVYDSIGNLVYRNMGSYYNRTSGYKPASVATGVTSYGGASADFSGTGLNATARNMVQENVWYLGSPFGKKLVEQMDMYYNERNGKYTYGENPVSWRGKVGLMYVLDYLAANLALIVSGGAYDFSTGCADNWLCVAEGEDYEWTLAQYFDSSSDVAYAASNGNCYSLGNVSDDAGGVRPVLYLKSGIKVTGEGTVGSKYQIVS